jgi:hypothetical protein
MKNLKTTFTSSLFAALFILFTSYTCDDQDGGSCNWDDDYAAFEQTVTKFYTSPNRSTCENLKSKAFDLINKYEDCSGFTAIAKTLRDQWSAIPCNGF